jgi:hypothetical protein
MLRPNTPTGEQPVQRNPTVTSRILLALVDELHLQGLRRHADQCGAGPRERIALLWGELERADPPMAAWLRNNLKSN